MPSTYDYQTPAGIALPQRPWFRPLIDRSDPLYELRGDLFWAYAYGEPGSPEGPVRQDLIVEAVGRQRAERDRRWDMVFQIVPNLRIFGGVPVTPIPGLGPEFAYLTWSDYCKLQKRLQGYPRTFTGCHLKLRFFSNRNAMIYVHEPQG